MSRRRNSSVQDLLNLYRSPGVSESSPRTRARDEGLSESCDRLMEQPSINSFVREFPDETEAIESEIIRLLRSAVREASGTAATESERGQNLLSAFGVEDAQSQVQRWNKRNRYRKHLADTYRSGEIPLDSYDEESRRLRVAGGGSRKTAEEFKQRILRDWKAALDATRLRLEPGVSEEQHRRIIKEMERQIARFRSMAELLAPFRRFMASSWDLAGSTQHESIFDLFQRSQRILDQEQQIRAIADRLGRLDRAERDHRNRILKSFSTPEAWITNRAAKSTVVGVRESDDISAIISPEAVLLSSDQTEDLFYLKFAEKKLLTYDYQPEARTRATALPGRSKERFKVQKRGPVILAVDTSASMEGEWEMDAKALALALVRIAFRQQRAVYVISFSQATDSMVLSPARKGSLGKLIEFLLMSFHGGTDLSKALSDGLTRLQDQEFRKADMVFLTDGDAEIFGRDQVARMNAARKEGVRFYGLLVGDAANKGVLAQFDFNWRFHDAQLSELAINLESFRQNKLGPQSKKKRRASTNIRV